MEKNRIARTWLLPFLASLIALLTCIASSLNDVKPALACSGVGPRNLEQLFSNDLTSSDSAAVVVIAEVVSIQSLSGRSPGLLIERTVATFTPLLVLSGVLDPAATSVGPLGRTGPDCSGGPTLQPGDKVLMFLRQQPRYPAYASWYLSVFTDTVLFVGPSASLLTPDEDRYLVPLGATAEVISRALDWANASAATRTVAAEILQSLAPGARLSNSGGASIKPPNAGDAGLVLR